MFYEKLGISFQREKHGSGLEHFSTELNGIVLELYPATDKYPVDSCRLGFVLPDNDAMFLENQNIQVVSQYFSAQFQVNVITDPDGRKLEISSVINKPQPV